MERSISKRRRDPNWIIKRTEVEVTRSPTWERDLESRFEFLLPSAHQRLRGNKNGRREMAVPGRFICGTVAEKK